MRGHEVGIIKAYKMNSTVVISGTEDSLPYHIFLFCLVAKIYHFSSLTILLVRKCRLGFLRPSHNTSSSFFQTYFPF